MAVVMTSASVISRCILPKPFDPDDLVRLLNQRLDDASYAAD
jgi:hypothetical protein